MLPVTQHAIEIIKNKGFTIAWSNQHLIPLWVSYTLKYPWKYRLSRRPRYFNADKRTQQSASSWNYSGSHYDRGHLAPNYAITRNYGRKAQKQTFLTSNAAPMTAKLNRKVWQRLEEAITSYILPDKGKVTIITGPILTQSPAKLRKKISIPKAFYKIIVNHNYKQAIAFVIPQKVKGNESLKQFVSTIDDIESLTGIDFFSQLPKWQEKRLEKSTNTHYWKLNQYHTLPARY